ncbi:hypothetical protein [Deinococcus multiflagellatus]|uniref:Uncharacterized protein n=2 Tax=Deinococcus multiflagellatus TaxID=1656887 RepID=A0ABW1ZV40_9DEIO|nr:hypothetical protein [Deinococcus multiflagellatus]MBZ9714466.1 hypothetical protein [Deinococcus multiflagellatus]
MSTDRLHLEQTYLPNVPQPLADAVWTFALQQSRLLPHHDLAQAYRDVAALIRLARRTGDVG